jgi:hypothetical protein
LSSTAKFQAKNAGHKRTDAQTQRGCGDLASDQFTKPSTKGSNMVLTLHYSLKAQGSDAQARKLINALHQTAQDLPFKELGNIVDLSGDLCDFNQCCSVPGSFRRQCFCQL